VKRLGLLLLVALLIASTGGLLELVCGEPCSAESSSQPADGACPPTCARCHCARPFELVVSFEVGLAPAVERERPARRPIAFPSVPHDIFHVPKPALG
jgi:hypothetical protein